MKVGILSSYPTEGCGVSKYTKDLVIGLEHNQANVFAYRIYFYKQKIRNVFSLIKIAYRILNQKLEIVHVQYTPPICGPLITPFLYSLKFFSSAKIIITAHEKPEGYLRHIKNKNIKFCFILYEKSIFRLADRVLVHTTEHRKELINRYKLKKEKIEIIPHGINEEMGVTDFQIHKIKKKYNIEKEVLTFFGAIRPNKGVEYLILAFSEVIKKRKNLILLIAGSAPKIWSEYLENLKNLTIDLDIEDHVRFTGFVEDKYIPVILKISKIVILPYVRITQSGVLYREIIPYSKPVIVSDVGGIAETVRKYRIGVVVPPKDVESLCTAILDLLTDKGKIKMYENNVSKIKNKFAWNNVAKLHIEIYQEVSS